MRRTGCRPHKVNGEGESLVKSASGTATDKVGRDTQQRTVTRADLSEAVYQKVGLSRTESAELVEHVMSEMAEAIARG